jgi:hypothetical protein
MKPSFLITGLEAHPIRRGTRNSFRPWFQPQPPEPVLPPGTAPNPFLRIAHLPRLSRVIFDVTNCPAQVRRVANQRIPVQSRDRFPFGAARHWEGIREIEGYELGHVGRVEVGPLTTWK